ncbi:unannotated protein [freshwater metagenome]|uniref:Unannotated protein n=1 Tax=freshwater metagenome TaxID=449393 RepID=A0A6J6C5R4_9ZZZZ
MILREIGKSHGIKGDPIDSTHHQGMTRDFHHHSVNPTLLHHRQEGEQVRCLRSGADAGNGFAINSGGDRSDQTRCTSSGSQGSIKQVRRGCFSIRTSDSHHGHGLSRIAINRGSCNTKHLANVRDNKARQPDGIGNCCTDFICQDRDSAIGHRLLNELRSVKSCPGESDIQVTIVHGS